MGYDMHVRNAPKHEHDYLRRNIFGMWPTVEAMVSLGMAHYSEDQPFPTLDGSYEDHVDYDGDDNEIGKTEQGRAYLAAVKAHLSEHRDGGPGIPAHKFSSNDGWHVTKQECQQALDAYDQATANGTPHPEWLHDDVIPFLRLAAEHDGFEVH